MLEDRLSPQARMVVASVFSLAVGTSAAAYALWPHAGSLSPQTSLHSVKMISSGCTPFKPDGKPYEFGQDYFTTENRLDAWNKHLKPLAGRPVNYLEVGIWKGQSMIWMLDNVLTSPESTTTGIDLVIYPEYSRNLMRSGACNKVTNHHGRSQDVLHTLPKEAFDIVYIDGSHLGQDVLVDAVLAFDRLKVGGLLVFDDYKWYTEWASDIRPQIAIESFVTMYRHQLEMVHKDYQLIVRKREHPCDFDKFRRSPIGPYCYHWVNGDLVRQTDKQPVQISLGERKLVVEIASSAQFGNIDYPLDKFEDRPEFQTMNKRLRLFD